MTEMTPRERFIAALERKPLKGRVPHFELVFFLTMEAFGKIHFSQRAYHQWDQMEEKERQLHRNDSADLYIMTAEKYEHSAIFIHPNPGSEDETVRLIDLIREKSGDKYYITMHGDCTYGLPNGNNMIEFSCQMVDEPEYLHDRAKKMNDETFSFAERVKSRTSLDGITLCSDYCLNQGPFMSPNQFAEFTAPYLKDLITRYREIGLYTIKHTDGNIMPIIDQLVDCNPHALHSIDPQALVDIAEVKRLYGDRIAVVGNVNCGLMDTGTDEEVIESAKYALKHGMPGYGYIFSTSNCVYTGMELRRYEMILDVWRKYGNYE